MAAVARLTKFQEIQKRATTLEESRKRSESAEKKVDFSRRRKEILKLEKEANSVKEEVIQIEEVAKALANRKSSLAEGLRRRQQKVTLLSNSWATATGCSNSCRCRPLV
ncbi:hypothetical protein L596_009512 [Steinernema carpocapsae]|uniref:Uncharacterized protein n=1 Tax=Steinernema carpocapsae TaxID=34508 RepID=A0A4U5PFR5_STECR|nr:hypothetical protein L596_009512 [Steinernema carpocapsae]